MSKCQANFNDKDKDKDRERQRQKQRQYRGEEITLAEPATSERKQVKKLRLGLATRQLVADTVIKHRLFYFLL